MSWKQGASLIIAIQVIASMRNLLGVSGIIAAVCK
jgi:hypothetical protein